MMICLNEPLCPLLKDCVQLNQYKLKDEIGKVKWNKYICNIISHHTSELLTIGLLHLPGIIHK